MSRSTNPESITVGQTRSLAAKWLADVYAGAGAFATKIDPGAKKPSNDHLLAALDKIRDLAWRERDRSGDGGVRWPKLHLPVPDSVVAAASQQRQLVRLWLAAVNVRAERFAAVLDLPARKLLVPVASAALSARRALEDLPYDTDVSPSLDPEDDCCMCYVQESDTGELLHQESCAHSPKIPSAAEHDARRAVERRGESS